MIHGRNRDYLTFWRRTRAKDSLGNPLREYTQIADAMGDIEDTVSAGDGMAQLQEQGTIGTRIYVGFSDILAGMAQRDQIRSGGRVFDIRGGPLGIAAREMLTFHCDIHQSEVVNP